MMKRLIPAILMTAILLTVNLISDRYVRRICVEMIALTEQCEEEYRAENNVALAELKEKWLQKEYGLSFFVNHQVLTNVEHEINGLSRYQTDDEKAVFQSHIDSIKIMLMQIADETKLNIKSIA